MVPRSGKIIQMRDKINYSSKNMKDYYNSISQGYDELHEIEQLNKLRQITDNLKDKKYKKILDIGCGSGISSRHFTNKTKKIIGIDPSDCLIRIAERKKSQKESYIIGEAENLPFDDNEFDLLISITAIQNFYNLEKAVKEMKRVCKGDFIITYLSGCSSEKKINNLLIKELGLNLVIEGKDKIYM
ncbi:MAG: class I SAM-dependent methyltransferase [Nanobdellota archaeon]